MYRYKNYEKLSKFFNKLALEGKKMPNMTGISKQTNVSTSTISRFAIKKGYYSFPAMRADFNISLKKETFNDYGLLTWLSKLKNRKIVVITSVSTKIVGIHCVDRLKKLGFDVRCVNSQNASGRVDEAMASIKKNEVIFFISITCESNWYTKIKTLKNNKIILSTSSPSTKQNGYLILIEKFIPKSNDYYEKNKSVISLFNWLDNVINVFSIEMKK